MDLQRTGFARILWDPVLPLKRGCRESEGEEPQVPHLRGANVMGSQ